jgi:hypothetical protein
MNQQDKEDLKMLAGLAVVGWMLGTETGNKLCFALMEARERQVKALADVNKKLTVRVIQPQMESGIMQGYFPPVESETVIRAKMCATCGGTLFFDECLSLTCPKRWILKGREVKAKGLLRARPRGQRRSERGQRSAVELPPAKEILQLSAPPTPEPKKVKGGRVLGSRNDRTNKLLDWYDGFRGKGLSDGRARAKAAVRYSERYKRDIEPATRTVDRAVKKYRKE